MWKFLQDVHDFKENKVQRSDWERALSLSEGLTEPSGVAFNELTEAIQTQDSLIRRELVEFIAGTRYRVDETPWERQLEGESAQAPL